jgi:hypothetical protein
VRLSGSLICIGTHKGMILQYDSSTFKILLQYQAHNSRVDDIWCLQARAIVSCSADSSRTLFIKSMSNEFSDTKITVPDLEVQDRINCLDIVEQNCIPSQLSCLIGTYKGRLLNVKSSWMSYKTEKLHESPTPVTQITSAFGIVAWATATDIFAMHLKRGQKICKFSPPEKQAGLDYTKELQPQI